MVKPITRHEKVLIFLWPIIAPLVVLELRAGFYLSLFIFFAAPAIYLSFKNTRIIKRSALFSAIGLPLALVIDYIMERTGGWHVFSITEPLRIFGYASLENFIWSFVFVYFITIFYEVFMHDHVKPKLYYPRIKYFAVFIFLIFVLFILALAFNPSVLDTHYFYLKFGLVIALLPVVLTIFRFPRLIPKLLEAGFYFFLLFFNYELVALSLGQWAFQRPAEILGFIKIGNFAIPYEELVFWMILSAMAVISYFEFFDDNGK